MPRLRARCRAAPIAPTATRTRCSASGALSGSKAGSPAILSDLQDRALQRSGGDEPLGRRRRQLPFPRSPLQRLDASSRRPRGRARRAPGTARRTRSRCMPPRASFTSKALAAGFSRSIRPRIAATSAASAVRSRGMATIAIEHARDVPHQLRVAGDRRGRATSPCAPRSRPRSADSARRPRHGSRAGPSRPDGRSRRSTS